MLQKIRDNLTGWITWFVVGLIVVPFAFWGIESFSTGGGDPVVVKVGSQEIHQSQFRAAYEQRYQQLQALMGANFRADLFDQNRFREAVLNDMQQESMLRQFTHDAGYRATDAAVFDYIRTIPAFQDQGKFNTETYKAALSRQGMTPERFEMQLRDSLTIDQMRESVVDTAFVTDAEVEQAYKLVNQQRWLSYAIFESSKYLSQVNISQEQVKARYETDKSQYTAPERIKLAYVELSLDSMPKAPAPAADVLKVIYDSEKDSRFSSAEERRARHILVNFGADKAASRKKIEDLAAQLKNGADFNLLAQANSDDPGSKNKGGDLGWIRRGQMVEKFEKVLFGMKVGELSEPVETEFGWHLIKLEGVKAATTKAFEDPEVQRQLVELYQSREAAKHFQEQSEKLEQLAFENPTALDVPAKELGLTVQVTDWFSRAGGAGIAANDAVKQAAFSTEVIKDGENSKPIAIGENKVAVIRKAEYEAARQKPLEEVAEEIRNKLKSEAAEAKAQADAAEVLAAAKAGKPLAEALTTKGVELQSPGLVRRDNTAVDKAIIEALFKLPRPDKGSARFAEAKLANGNVAVLSLSAVQDPEPPAKTAAEAARTRAQLRDVLAGAEFGSYRKAIEKVIKVKLVNPPQTEPAPKPE